MNGISLQREAGSSSVVLSGAFVPVAETGQECYGGRQESPGWRKLGKETRLRGKQRLRRFLEALWSLGCLKIQSLSFKCLSCTKQNICWQFILQTCIWDCFSSTGLRNKRLETTGCSFIRDGKWMIVHRSHGTLRACEKKQPVDLHVGTWKDPKALLLIETTIPLGGKKMEIYIKGVWWKLRFFVYDIVMFPFPP